MSFSDSVAPTYRDKIVNAARDAALAFIAEHPEHVAAGERYRARMDVLSAQAQVDRVKPEYEAAITALSEATERLNEVEREHRKQ